MRPLPCTDYVVSSWDRFMKMFIMSMPTLDGCFHHGRQTFTILLDRTLWNQFLEYQTIEPFPSKPLYFFCWLWEIWNSSTCIKPGTLALLASRTLLSSSSCRRCFDMSRLQIPNWRLQIPNCRLQIPNWRYTVIKIKDTTIVVSVVRSTIFNLEDFTHTRVVFSMFFSTLYLLFLCSCLSAIYPNAQLQTVAGRTGEIWVINFLKNSSEQRAAPSAQRRPAPRPAPTFFNWKYATIRKTYKKLKIGNATTFIF